MPASSVRANWASSRSIAARTGLAPLDQVRIRLAHGLDDDDAQLGHERLAPAEDPAMADGPAQDPAEHVAAALVRRQHPVRDQEDDRPGVVGDHLVAEPLGLECVGIVAHQLAHAFVDRREQIRIEVARDLLEDAGQAFEPESRVDARERQRYATGRALVELHEDEIPQLEPARAALRVVRDALRPLGQVGAAIEVDLAARAARSGVRHPPEVAVVARVDIAPDGHPLRRQADLVAPDLAGHLVVLVGRRGQALRRDAQVAGEEVPGVVDRLALEVVAEAPVAEHLEEGVMARRPADLLEVVVLAGDPQDPLVVRRPGVVALLDAGQDVLELDHAGVREEERRVAGRDEAGARHGRVAAFREELDEASTDLGGGQRPDPGVVLRDGVGHGRNGSERTARSSLRELRRRGSTRDRIR